MLSNGLKWLTLKDPAQGTVLLLTPVPRHGDIWGVLAPLRGTPWGDLITVVSGSSLSHALHGYATPLMREIGIEPKYRIQRIPVDLRPCLNGPLGCPMKTDACVPGLKMPICYEPPHDDADLRRAATTVMLAWKEGRYVVISDGADEFVLV